MEVSVTMADYEIHTDGCVLSGNRGGWAYTIANPNQPRDYQSASGFLRCDNPHSMELRAVMHALQRTKPGDRIIVITDSDYVCDHAPPQAAPGNGRDADLWRSVRTMANRRSVTWRRIRSGNAELNRVCDQQARAAAQNSNNS